MKKHLLVLPVVCILVLAISPNGYAANKAPTTSHIELLDKATMEKLVIVEAPANQHFLSDLMGDWDFDLKYWSKKDADWELSTGTATNEMILGGRFLSSTLRTVLNIGGNTIAYEARSFLGYDAGRKSYTSTLIDTLHSGVTTGSGQYNEKTKSLEEKGTFTNPAIGKERGYRSELQITGAGYKRTVFITDTAGQEFKVLEIDFRRKQ